MKEDEKKQREKRNFRIKEKSTSKKEEIRKGRIENKKKRQEGDEDLKEDEGLCK